MIFTITHEYYFDPNFWRVQVHSSRVGLLPGCILDIWDPRHCEGLWKPVNEPQVSGSLSNAAIFCLILETPIATVPDKPPF